MAPTAETVRTLRAMIERIDLKLLELIEEDPGLDHERMQRIAALEGGAAAVAVASGQAASAFAVQNLARAGDNIVSGTDLYGGTWNLFANTLRDQGIEVRFVDPEDPQAFARATDARTRAYYAETLPNPKLSVFPIAEVAEIGRKLGVPLIVDNTAAPLLSQAIASTSGHSLFKAWRRVAIRWRRPKFSFSSFSNSRSLRASRRSCRTFTDWKSRERELP